MKEGGKGAREERASEQRRYLHCHLCMRHGTMGGRVLLTHGASLGQIGTRDRGSYNLIRFGSVGLDKIDLTSKRMERILC